MTNCGVRDGYGRVSGAISVGPIEAMTDTLDWEPWYETAHLPGDSGRLGFVHHGDKDPGGHEV